MKKTNMLTAVLALGALVGPAAAQQPAKARTAPIVYATGTHEPFNPDTVVSMSGTIVGIQVYRNGQENYVDLLVRQRGGQTAVVELGPEWYVRDLPVKLATQSEVSLQGSKVRVNGTWAFMATGLRIKGERVNFRSLTGKPHWER